MPDPDTAERWTQDLEDLIAGDIAVEAPMLTPDACQRFAQIALRRAYDSTRPPASPTERSDLGRVVPPAPDPESSTKRNGDDRS